MTPEKLRSRIETVLWSYRGGEASYNDTISCLIDICDDVAADTRDATLEEVLDLCRGVHREEVERQLGQQDPLPMY